MSPADLATITTAVLAIVTVIVGLATLYLRLFVRNEMADLKDALDEKYICKEKLDLRVKPLELRVTNLEHWRGAGAE